MHQKKKLEIEIQSDLKSFFFEECTNIANKQGLNISPLLQSYLGEMLSRFMDVGYLVQESSDPFAQEGQTEIPSLGIELMKGMQSSSFEQLFHMQKVGDLALYIAGFFPGYLDRRSLDLDYFSAVGGQAYQRAGHIKSTLDAENQLNVYFELAEKFASLTEVLMELSDQKLLTSKEDQLKLYEKWLLTGNPRLSRMLKEAGLVLLEMPKSSKN